MCTTRWLHTFIYGNMIATAVLAPISITSHKWRSLRMDRLAWMWFGEWILSSSLQSLIATIKRDYISSFEDFITLKNKTVLDVCIYSLIYSHLVLFSTVYKLLSTYLHTQIQCNLHTLQKFFSGSQCLLITLAPHHLFPA